MGDPKIAVGLQIGTQPPLGTVRAFALFARLARLESVMAVDHLQNIFPTAIWDEGDPRLWLSRSCRALAKGWGAASLR